MYYVEVSLTSQGVPPLRGVKRGVAKTSYFRAKFVDISKTVEDTSKVAISD